MTLRPGGAALTRPLPLGPGAGLGPAAWLLFPLASMSCRLSNWLQYILVYTYDYDLKKSYPSPAILDPEMA